MGTPALRLQSQPRPLSHWQAPSHWQQARRDWVSAWGWLGTGISKVGSAADDIYAKYGLLLLLNLNFFIFCIFYSRSSFCRFFCRFFAYSVHIFTYFCIFCKYFYIFLHIFACSGFFCIFRVYASAYLYIFMHIESIFSHICIFLVHWWYFYIYVHIICMFWHIFA